MSRKAPPKIPQAIRNEVKARTRGYCHMCLYGAGGPLAIGLNEHGTRLLIVGVLTLGDKPPKPIAHLHHVFMVQRWPELAKHPANLIGLCVDHHFDHEGTAGHGTPRRIPRDALPAETLALAAGNGPLLNELDRKYP